MVYPQLLMLTGYPHGCPLPPGYEEVKLNRDAATVMFTTGVTEFHRLHTNLTVGAPLTGQMVTVTKDSIERLALNVVFAALGMEMER